MFRKKSSRKFSYILSYVVIFIICSTSFIFAQGGEPSLSCPSAVLIEYETGTVLYEKNKDTPMYPASTTKIMTALLALENLDLKKELSTPSDFGPGEGSSMYLLPGETFTVEELLQGLMIKSANDAAVVLAREISGDVPSFAKLMNQRALELGCVATNFTNPNGLPDPNHTTCAYDLALMAREAMKHELFRELIKTPFIQIRATDQTPIRYYQNTNRFLWSNKTINYNGTQIPIKYDIVDGVKTGFTDEAKNCLVSTGEKNGIRVIAVSLKNEGLDVYLNSRKLLDYGFHNFRKKTLVEENKVIGNIIFQNSVEKNLEYYVKENVSIVENNKSNDSYSMEAIIDDSLKLPLQKDEVVGEYIIKKNGELYRSLPLFSANSLESIYSIDNLMRIIQQYRYYVIGGCSALVFFIVSFVFLYRSFVSNKKRNRRKVIRL